MAALSSSVLMRPLQLGALLLPHRALMAPLTRARADTHGVHNVTLASKYYGIASPTLIAPSLGPEYSI